MRHLRVTRRQKSRSGKVLVLVAVLLPTMCGVLGLVIDVGLWFSHARMLQAMADAAATSAAYDKMHGKSNEAALSTAQQLVSGNPTIEQPKLVLSCPPQKGEFAGSNKHVEVEVSAAPPSCFLGWFGGTGGEFRISARAVAGFEVSTSDAAIVVLDPDPPPISIPPLPSLPILPPLPALVGGLEVLGLGEVRVDGSVLVNTEWGGVDENGKKIGRSRGLLGLAHAVSATPAVSLSRMRCRDLRVVGGVDHTWNYAPFKSGQPHPLSAGRLPAPDPYAKLPVPTYSADPKYVKGDLKGAATIISLPILLPPVQLKPGVYEWIEVIAGRVKFEPGVYIIRGRNPLTQISLTLLAGQVEADGVTFYITDNGGYTPSNPGPDALDGESRPAYGLLEGVLPAAVVNLGLLGSTLRGMNDPSSPYHGVLVFQRRHDRRPIVVVQENLLGPGVVDGSIYSKWGHVILVGKGECNSRFVVGSMRILALLDLLLKPTKPLPAATDVFLVE